MKFIPGILIGLFFGLFFIGVFERPLEDYCLNRFANDKQIGEFCDKRLKRLTNIGYKKRKQSANISGKKIWADKNGYIVSIDYEGAGDNISTRKIKITQVKKKDGKIYLIAYSFDKKANRLFRLDRVKEFYNQDGNIIPKSEIFKALNIKD